MAPFIRLCLPALVVVSLITPNLAQHAPAGGPATQRMDEVIRAYADDPPRTFMGVVLVARGDEVLFVRGYGLANVEWSIPHTPATRIPIGSISNQFTAAAILLLEGVGRLRVADSIASYLPDAPPAWGAVTFHDLLSDRDSTAGYRLLVSLIERTSGQRYEDFVRENIFEPLDMKDSGSATPPAVVRSLASGYIAQPGSALGPSGPLLHAPFTDLADGKGTGSLYATAGDLHRWTRGLFAGKLLRRDSLTKMITPAENGYAYGLAVKTRDSRRQFFHGGSGPGFTSYLVYYPESQVTVVVLSNLRLSGTSDERQRPLLGSLADSLGALAHGETVAVTAR